MGRKFEPGVPYYGLNSNHTQHKKIRLLISKFDSDGYWIYKCLVDKIYSGKGYFLDLSCEDDLELFASDHAKKPLSLVRQVIEYCCEKKAFSKDLYERFQILTSRRIQNNYIHATKERARKDTHIPLIRKFFIAELDNIHFSDVLKHYVFDDNNTLYTLVTNHLDNLRKNCSAEQFDSSAEQFDSSGTFPRNKTHRIEENNKYSNTNVLRSEDKSSLPKLEKPEVLEVGKEEQPIQPPVLPPPPLKRKNTKAEKKKSIEQLLRPLVKNKYLLWYEERESRKYLWTHGPADKWLSIVVSKFVSYAQLEFSGLAPDDDQVVNRARDLFFNMLDDWDKIKTPFYKTTDLKNIAKEINNILSQINSANGTENKPSADAHQKNNGASVGRTIVFDKL